MLKKLLKIYEDESVYSYLARLYVHNGYGSSVAFTKVIFNRSSEYMDYNFINHLSKGFRNQLEKYISFDELLTEHTLFKYYVRFMPLEKRIRAYDYALSNEPGLYKYLAIPLNKDNYYLRYCPECVMEDRNKYGESFFHINHCFPNIKICPKHNCELIDTNIKNTKMKDSTFVPLELIVDDLSVKEYDKNDINVLVTKYVDDLFHLDLDIYKNELISNYLDYMLDSKYKKGITNKRNIDYIIHDLNKFYVDLNNYDITKSKVSEIYRNLSWNVFDICLISYFEGITTDELVKYKNEIIESNLSIKIIELYNEYKNYSKVGRLLGLDKETVRKKVLSINSKEEL